MGRDRGRRAAPSQHPVPSGCERSWTRSDLLSWLSSATATSQRCYVSAIAMETMSQVRTLAEPNTQLGRGGGGGAGGGRGGGGVVSQGLCQWERRGISLDSP